MYQIHIMQLNYFCNNNYHYHYVYQMYILSQINSNNILTKNKPGDIIQFMNCIYITKYTII